MTKSVDPQVRQLRRVPEGARGSRHLLSDDEPASGGAPDGARTPLRVLIVEDSEDDAKLVLRALDRGGFEAVHQRVQTASGLQAVLSRERWDAVLSDFNMPGFSGMEALRIFQSMHLDIPFILISGTVGEETAADAMQAGASDYVMKNKLARLAPALERELKESQMRAAHRAGQTELIESEARFRSLTALSSDWYWEQDAAFRFVRFSGGDRDKGWGADQHSAVGLCRWELTGVVPVGGSWVEHKALLEAHEPFRDFEYRRILGDGTLQYVAASGEPVFDADGRFTGYRGVASDITQRKRTERELQRFRAAMDISADAIVLVDRTSMRYIDVNQTTCDMSGLTREQLLGMTPKDLTGRSRESLEAEYDALIADAGSVADRVEGEYPHKDGSTVFVETRRRALSTETGWVIVGTTRDITERVRGEEALRRFSAAMDATTDAIYLVDRTSMRFVHVNEAACSMQGRTRAELFALGPQGVLSASRAELEHTYDAMIASGVPAQPVEMLRTRKDGTQAWVELRRHAQRSGGGWTIVTLARDITERKAADGRIKRLNRIYAVLSGINTLIVRVRDRDELFREACRIGVEAGHFAKAWLGMVDRDSKQIRIVASRGGDPLFFPKLEAELGRQFPTGGGLVSRALASRRPVISNHMASDPEVLMKDHAVVGGAQSLAILPLVVAGEAVGVFVLNADVPAFFDDDEIKLLVELAGDIAFAIDHIGKQEQLNYLAFYDGLTGIANRSLFLERVAQFVRSAATGGHKLVVFLIDIERFKNINDSLGREAGDELLRQAAAWLKLNGGDANLIGRLGADQFAMVLPEVNPAGDIAHLLEKTIAAFMEHPFRLNDAVFRIAVKVGVALFPEDGADADALLRNAEVALKKAKARGERYVFYKQTMNEGGAAKLSLENKLRSALQKEEFVLHYQPKVSLQSGRLTSAEALIRWNDPETGLVPPGRFIPILEETGLIHDVGRWALRRALGDYLRWRGAGLPAVRIAVNVSPLQLRSRNFVAEIGEVLGVDPNAAAGLEVEITESVIMEDVQGSIAALKAIRDLGLTIAIDDFGTGFSSLSYLASLPVDTLKIDRSFVTDMNSGPDGLALVSTIINLAHSFRLKVVAEGVETEEQSRLLRLLGCDEMQGFLFSRPVPAEVFERNFLGAPGAIR